MGVIVIVKLALAPVFTAKVVVVVADYFVNEGVLGALSRSVLGAVQTVDRHPNSQ